MGEKEDAAGSIAEQIGHREASAQQYREKGDICQAEQCGEVEVLADLHQCGEGEDEDGHQPQLLRDEDTHQAAEQQGDENITAVGADEAVPHKEGDKDLDKKQSHGQGDVDFTETGVHRLFYSLFEFMFGLICR